jgi:hypothetical protein
MDYITARQAAEKWDISLRWVQVYLKDSRIDGAICLGRVWMIPKDVVKPFDRRVKNRIGTTYDTTLTHLCGMIKAVGREA